MISHNDIVLFCLSALIIALQAFKMGLALGAHWGREEGAK